MPSARSVRRILVSSADSTPMPLSLGEGGRVLAGPMLPDAEVNTTVVENIYVMQCFIAIMCRLVRHANLPL
jgi:hypothetical protein